MKDLYELKHGTSIVIHIKEDVVRIAADSQLNAIKGSDFANTEASYSTKIFTKYNLYYCFAGILRSTTSAGKNLDVHETMEKVLDSEKDVQQALNDFSVFIIPQLSAAFEVFKEENVSFFNSFLNQEILVVTMICFVEEKPLVRFKTFRLVGSIDAWDIQTEDNVSEPGSDKGQLMVIGHRENVVNFLKQNAAKYFADSSNDFNEKLACLIKLEAEKYPESVGFPVDLFVIKKDECQRLRFEQCTIDFNSGEW